MKQWNFTFNAQGSRIIIIVVQVGTMKIYVIVMEVFKKKERENKMKFNLPQKNGVFLNFTTC